ncbi:MAG: gliding motility-associated C-terminal domain-containing protein [Bacteroidales bacterium]|nr:gliding motility-associated C-terminal domain-containing protein [Bacteroidales bacterium]
MIKKIFFFIILSLTISSIVLGQIDIPDAPKFVSASIIPESNPTSVHIKWLPSDSLDVQGYIVYQIINSITETIDTVWGRETTEFTYQGLGNYQKSEKFRLVSFDNQYYKSNITAPHTTIYLTHDYDICDKNVSLTWTEYEGWQTVKEYNIYRRKSGETYERLTKISGDKTSYEDEDLEPHTEYYYYIEAVSSEDYKASSNSVNVKTEAYSAPTFLIASHASVNNNKIDLKFVVDNTAEISEYRIQRAKSADGGYKTIKIIPNSGLDVILASDNEIDTNNEVFYYRIASVNPCGDINAYSNYACNIVLKAETGEDLNHYLNWNEYEQWLNGVFNYKIYRIFDDIEAEIDVTPNNLFNYTYNIEWYVKYCHNLKIHISNKYCYYVEAIEKQGDMPILNKERSRSNIACVYHEPVFWIPNAFNASSLEPENKVFKPIISFIQDEPYEFSVYNRFGMKVFETNKPQEAWDGTINKTHTAPSQYYTYYVKYFDFNDKQHIKTGIFFLFIK